MLLFFRQGPLPGQGGETLARSRDTRSGLPFAHDRHKAGHKVAAMQGGKLFAYLFDDLVVEAGLSRGKFDFDRMS